MKTALYSATDLNVSYTAPQLKEAGYSSENLKAAQFSVTALKGAGFSAAEMKTAKYTATEMKDIFTAAQQKIGGYTATEMISLYTVLQLKDAKYTPTELMGAGISATALYTAFNTTSTETKSVTRAVVSGLLSSTAKSVVPLSTLVGYSFAPAVTSAVTIKVTAANAPVIIDKSELANGVAVVYAVLDGVSSYVVLPTWYSTIRVMSLGNETYRIYGSNGTTVLDNIVVAGDTRTYDGLTVVFGSVTATLAPQTAVNFVLTALDSQMVLTKSALLPQYFPSLICDATINLETRVPASVLQNTFFFRTDDAQANSDYYIDMSKWNDYQTTLNPKNGIVGEGRYVPNDGVGKDFLRDLARQLFGTYLGADLFTNEDVIVSQINTSCDNVAREISTLLSKFDQNLGIAGLMQTDEFQKKFLSENVASPSNISREMLNQLISSAPGRFADLETDYKYNSTDDGFYKMPILKDDTFSFKITVTPSETQLKFNGESFQPRTYKVVLTVV